MSVRRSMIAASESMPWSCSRPLSVVKVLCRLSTLRWGSGLDVWKRLVGEVRAFQDRAVPMWERRLEQLQILIVSQSFHQVDADDFAGGILIDAAVQCLDFRQDRFVVHCCFGRTSAGFGEGCSGVGLGAGAFRASGERAFRWRPWRGIPVPFWAWDFRRFSAGSRIFRQPHSNRQPRKIKVGRIIGLYLLGLRREE